MIPLLVLGFKAVIGPNDRLFQLVIVLLIRDLSTDDGDAREDA